MRDSTARSLDALLTSAQDGNDDVREAVIASLRSLAGKDTVAVLQACERWLVSQKPSSTPEIQRLTVVKTIKEILHSHASYKSLPDTLVGALIKAAIAEMTAGNDLTSEWARTSSVLCSDVCELAPSVGIPALVDPIQSTALPHYFVMDTLAHFARESPLRFLPYLKETMAKVLPILGLVKQDNHRQVFATALAAFADAVLQLSQKNCDLTPRSAPSSKLSATEFADEMYTAINFLINDWSRISEQRVRGPVLHAIGSMFALLSDDNRNTQMKKVVELIVAGLKREKPKDQLTVSKGFASSLSNCTDAARLAFAQQPIMESILNALLSNLVGSLAAQGATPDDATIVQNTHALLQAAEHLGNYHMDPLITFLSKTLDLKNGNKEPPVRAACLTIIKHLISRKNLDAKVDPYKDNIIAVVKLANEDQDWRVKKAYVNCVMAMGAAELNYFAAVGGTDLLTYLIKNAAIPTAVVQEFDEASQKKKELLLLGTSPQEVRDTCRNAIALFTASKSKLDDILWPFLMEHFGLYSADPTLQFALPTICRALVQLGRRKETTDTFYVDFKTQVNVPPPEHLATVFLLHAMSKEKYSDQDLQSILAAMEVVCPILDDPYRFPDMEEPPIATLWLSTLPQLQEVLAKGEVSNTDWEDMMCRLVVKTMGARGIEDWAAAMTNAAVSLIPSTNVSPATQVMARNILTIVGIGVSKCTKRDFVASVVDNLIEVTDHALENQRAGLAKGLGYVAQQHPDVALDRLSNLSKVVEKKSFFGGGSKGKKGPLEISRSVSGQGMCNATKRMSQTILPSRLEAAVFPVLSGVLADFKAPEVRDEVLATIPIIEAPVKKLGGYNFKGRDAFLDLLLGLAGLHPPNPKGPPPPVLLKLCTLVANAMSAVVRCTPTPSIADEMLNKIVSNLVVPFAAKEWTECTEENQNVGQESMRSLMTALVNNPPTLQLDKLWGPLLAMSQSDRPSERSKSLLILQATVDAATTRVEEDAQKESGSSGQHREGSTIGVIVSRMVPRVLDVLPPVRAAAIDIIARSVRLFSLFHPESIQAGEIDVDGVVAELEGLSGRATALVRDGTQAAEREAQAITKILCAQIVTVFHQAEHFMPVIESLLANGIVDRQDGGANCAGVVLHGMIRGLGGALPESVAKKYLADMVAAIPMVGPRDQVLNGLLLSVRNLTKHHTLACFHAVLNLMEPPYSLPVVQAIESIGNDSGLARTFLLHCVDSLLNSQLVEERADAKDKRRSVMDVTIVPLAAAAAIGAVSQAAKGAEIAAEMKISLFGTLFLYLATVMDLGNPIRVQVVVQSLHQLLKAVAGETTLERMERYGWQNLADPTFFLVACCEILKYLNAEEQGDDGSKDRELQVTPFAGLPLPPSEPGQFVAEVAQFILPYANKPTPSHRRTAINIAGFLLQSCLHHADLLQAIVTALLSRSGSDELPLLRAEALLSMGHLKVHRYDDISPYVAPVLSALLSNFGEPHEQVVVSSMTTLHGLVSALSDKRQVAPTVVNIILKVKILFECPHPGIRKLSFDILGLIFDLANGGHLTASMVEQQVHLHLATILVHVEDDDIEVRRSNKAALLSSMKFLASQQSNSDAKQKIEEVFSKPNIQVQNKTRLDEFLNDFCFMWVLHFPGNVSDLLTSLQVFFDSDREALRMCAVACCGYMLRHLPPKELQRASVDQLVQNLTRRLNPDKEKSPAVRSRVARAIGMMNEL
jgi:hypothetical protein